MLPIFFNQRICVLPNCRTLMNYIKQRQQSNILLAQPHSKSGHHSSSQLTGRVSKTHFAFFLLRLAHAADNKRMSIRPVSTKPASFCHNATPTMPWYWSSTQTKTARYRFWASMSGLVAMLPLMFTKFRIQVHCLRKFLSML